MAIKVKKRHGIWNKIVSPIITNLILKKKCNYTYDKCDIKPPFLVLANHTTDYGAFGMSKSFDTPIYFVMSDHVSSKPFVGKLIRHLVHPIPITKSTTDTETVRNIFSVIRQGAPVALFPEGNKSFAGDMSEMKPSIAKLVKKLKVPVVIYTFEGGYLTYPRWSKIKRPGRYHGFAKRILTVEEIDALSHDELFSVIKEELKVNAYDIQERDMIKYSGKDLAVGIESMLYICPKCHAISSLHGQGNDVVCDKCDFRATYTEYGYLEGAPEKRLDKLDEMQKEYVTNLDYSKFSEDDIITSDDGFDIKQKVDKYKNKNVGEFKMNLYKNRFELVNNKETIIIPFESISGYAIEAANGIQLSLIDGRVYRFKNPNPVSGLKYINIYSAILGKEMKF